MFCMSLERKGIGEAEIHFEFYHHLKNALDKKDTYDGIRFTDVKPEHRTPSGGKADIAIFADGKIWLVVEAKRLLDGRYIRQFDPYSPEVIKQAMGYAIELGAPYFATYNKNVLVLFKTYERFVPLPQRRQRHYDVKGLDLEVFSHQLLQDLINIDKEVIRWDADDIAFIERLHTFHNFIMPFVFESLKKALKDKKFAEEYKRWLAKQGFELNEARNINIAKQAAYLIMNKILFYKILELRRPTEIEPLRKVDNIKNLSKILEERFTDITNRIDYKAVFQQDPMFSKIPSENIAEILNEFIDEVSTYDLSKVESDIIGRIYERLISPVERHVLGQYYTPPPIIDLIVQMCIKNPNDKVLDPAVGSGGFLIRAYHNLLKLKGKDKINDKIHQGILNQLWAVDINQFPAHLATINLTMQNVRSKSDNVNVYVSDFFKLTNPTQAYFYKGRITANEVNADKEDLVKFPYPFDALVANPPYTRQEEITAKEEVRRIALRYNNQQVELSGRSGIYAYFFVHGAKFLKNGKKMGMVTSNSWLESGFGEDLQKFFLDRFKVNCVIGYDNRVFEDAAVNTCVTILEKAEGKAFGKSRDDNLVKFIKLKEKLDTNKIVSIAEKTRRDRTTDSMNIRVKKQRDLSQDVKWSKYLYAPDIYFELSESDKLIKLINVADVAYGIKTGANDFFILKDDDIKEWGIKKYAKPAIKSPREARYLDIRDEDLIHYMLFAHDNKSELKRKGETNILAYIRSGERRELNKKRSMRGRRYWYDLGKPEPAPILMQKYSWERTISILNKANAYAMDMFYEIRPKKKKNIKLLAGILNSNLTVLFCEVEGRVMLGEGALALMVYEAQKLPILNPNILSETVRKRIENAFSEIIKAQRSGDVDKEEKARKELDIAVLKPLGFERKLDELRSGVEEMRKMRRERKKIEVLIDNGIQRKKRVRTRRPKTVEDWRSKPKGKIKGLDEWT